MRIISKYKDYYDGVGAGDLDPIPVYERHEKKIELIQPFPNDWRHSKYLIVNRNNKVDGYKSKLVERSLYTYVIGYCGELYPILKVVQDEGSISKYWYEYDVSTILDYVKTNRWQGIHRYKEILNEWLELIKTLKLQDIFKEHNVPVFIFDGFEIDTRKGTQPVLHVTLNPRLRKYEFYKIKDAYTTYQDIRMYVGNDLARDTEVNVPTGDDKTLAESKGYDKWSFRKESTKEK